MTLGALGLMLVVLNQAVFRNARRSDYKFFNCGITSRAKTRKPSMVRS